MKIWAGQLIPPLVGSHSETTGGINSTIWIDNLKSNNNSRIIKLQKSIVKLKTKAHSLQIIEIQHDGDTKTLRNYCQYQIFLSTISFYEHQIDYIDMK